MHHTHTLFKPTVPAGPRPGKDTKRLSPHKSPGATVALKTSPPPLLHSHIAQGRVTVQAKVLKAMGGAKTVADPSRWSVYKFGGTSVASADCYRTVRDIILAAQQSTPKMAVVVSAMGGKPKVTDLLIDTVLLAAKGDLAGYEQTLGVVRQKHVACAAALFSADGAKAYEAALDEDIHNLHDILRAVSLMRYSGEKIVELVSGHGEIWSARMLTRLFQDGGHDFAFVDARKVLFVDESGESGPDILWERSKAAMHELMAATPTACPVITGFIASTADGVVTTLKRDGSDYSASIFGRLLEATGITIWTDVDGVLSADPRRVPEAKVLADVSYSEAMELAYFGAKVIHPKTMTPAVAASIPIFIRNTFNPSFPGTRIFVSSASTIDRDKCVCGFSTVDNMALLNLEGSGMIGVPGIANRLFGAIQQTGISVSLIAQASSEYSISFATKESDAEAAAKAVTDEFFREFRSQLMNKVDVIKPCSIIAAVGDGMSNTKGAAGKFFKALGNAGVNVLAISQGSSERIISAVVKGSDSTKSLRAVHAAFLLSNQVISVGLVGRGKVARAMVEVIRAQADMLYGRFGTEFHIRAVMDSTGMVLSNETALDLEALDAAFEAKKVPADIKAFTKHVRAEHLPHAIIIDCSDAEEVAMEHPGWLEQNIHVVTANKKGLCGSMSLYNAILRQRKVKQHNYMYEVTVGGGLKIITSLQAMLIGGDRILRLEGALSASMNYVLGLISPVPPSKLVGVGPVGVAMNGSSNSSSSHSAGTQPDKAPLLLSQAVAEAARLDILERNPLNDLNGVEMAQKLLVLAREMGLPLRLNDVKIETLVPKDTPLADLGQHDEAVAARVAAAASRGAVLRYVGSINEDGAAEIGLREVPFEHPFATVRGAGYCFRIFSAFHNPDPITIQGTIGLPKATAAGLFSDLLFVAQRLGAKDKGHTVNGTNIVSDSIIEP